MFLPGVLFVVVSFCFFCFLAPFILFGSVMQHLDTCCYLKLYGVSISGCPAFVAVLYLADPSDSSMELHSGADDMKMFSM